MRRPACRPTAVGRDRRAGGGPRGTRGPCRTAPPGRHSPSSASRRAPAILLQWGDRGSKASTDRTATPWALRKSRISEGPVPTHVDHQVGGVDAGHLGQGGEPTEGVEMEARVVVHHAGEPPDRPRGGPAAVRDGVEPLRPGSAVPHQAPAQPSEGQETGRGGHGGHGDHREGCRRSTAGWPASRRARSGQVVTEHLRAVPDDHHRVEVRVGGDGELVLRRGCSRWGCSTRSAGGQLMRCRSSRAAGGHGPRPWGWSTRVPSP